MDGNGSDNDNDFFNPEEEVEITPSSNKVFFSTIFINKTTVFYDHSRIIYSIKNDISKN